MNLIKTSFLNGIAVVIKMLTLLGINKLLAVYVGPAGYAAIGQFQNAVQMVTTFTSGAINTGVIKYTAEYHSDPARQRSVWVTAGTITLIGSLVASVLVVSFSSDLASLFLKDVRLKGVFNWFGVGLIFFSFNTLLLAILNGKKEVLLYVVANVAGSLLSVVATYYLAVKFGLYGALVALVVYQSVSFFVTVGLCFKTDWFSLKNLVGTVDKEVARNLSKYALMAIVSAVSIPTTQILIRSHLGESFGWREAGYWEAMWRLSAAYLLMVTTTLSVYYLPKLAELKSGKEIKREIYNGYKIIMPLAILASAMMYLFKDLIIQLLFTEEFRPMSQLFAGQMVGDSLKIFSWLLAYVMLSKAMIKLFIFTEIASCISFYLFVWAFTEVWGFSGVSWAYAFNYLIYGFVMFLFVFRKLEANDSKENINE